MNLQQIQNAIVSYMLGMDLDPGEMNVWINAGIGDLSSVSRLEGIATINLVSGTDTYPLPADFMELVSLQTPQSTVGMSNPLDLDYAGRVSNEYQATLWAGNIILRPIPQKNDTMTLYYIRTPLQLVLNTDVPEIPAQHHQAIVFYAVAQAKKKFGLMGDAEVYEGNYQVAKRELAEFVANQKGPYYIQPESRRW